MKKVFLSAGMLAFMYSGVQAQNQLGNAQNMVSKASATASANGFDVNAIGKNIMNVLGPKLNLSQIQMPKVSGAVNTFLTAKEKILPLMQTDKTAYAQKFKGIFGNLKSSLGSTLTQNQMTQFLNLKPQANSATNVLSQLFY